MWQSGKVAMWQSGVCLLEIYGLRGVDDMFVFRIFILFG